MTTVPSDVRIRRPQEHEALMIELQDEAKFSTFRDILLFSAAIGYRFSRSVEITAAAGDPIRYETLTAPAHSEALINMIATNTATDDPEIMDDARLEERIKIFEKYACGGLEYIQEQVNVRRQPAALVVLDLVAEAFSEGGGAEPASVDELLSGLTWR